MAARMSHPLSSRWAAIRERVAEAAGRARRDVTDVRIVAVSKGVDAARIRELAAIGATRFGENYAQEWTAKRARLAEVPEIEWHFIGRLQRNKARLVAGAAMVHSLADARVAAALDAEARRAGTTLPVLVQVNVAGEASKDGVGPDALPRVLDEVRAMESLRVRGLMAIPPAVDAERARPFFRALRELRDRQTRAAELVELSMGMSADFEVAVEEGATLVRVGTALFGPREVKAR
jgi:pyridoxal phosphate enzyme (YggS family)